MASSLHTDRSAGFLILIGCFKLVKAAMLVTLGIGILHLVRGDAEATLHRWVHYIRVDPENHYIHLAISKITGLSVHRLKELSIGTFAYGGLLTCEGVGLVLRKRWAEYLTIVATTAFIPLEIYEIFHHLTMAKIIVFLLNVVIVAYLVYQLYRTTPHTAPTVPADGLEPALKPSLPKSID